eukprot:1231073-Pyramimonas_sp.AAC.1
MWISIRHSRRLGPRNLPFSCNIPAIRLYAQAARIIIWTKLEWDFSWHPPPGDRRRLCRASLRIAPLRIRAPGDEAVLISARAPRGGKGRQWRQYFDRSLADFVEAWSAHGRDNIIGGFN